MAQLVRQALAERGKLARRLVVGSVLAEPPLGLPAGSRLTARAGSVWYELPRPGRATARDSGQAK